MRTPRLRAPSSIGLFFGIVIASGSILFASASGGTTRPGVAVTPACGTAQLDIWLNTVGDGAAGSEYYKLEFTNLGARSCSLRGYPGVSAIDLAGRQVGSAATRNPAVAAKTITLNPEKSAVANLQVVDALNYPKSTCHPTTAAGVRVFPPNQTASRVVPYPFLVCARSGVRFLGVQNIGAS